MVKRLLRQEFVLPNGLQVVCLRKDEVLILYEQVQEYLKHGIELRQGDTIFDVGANIGLFSLWLYQLFQRNLKIYAFEPIPVLFEILKLNTERFDSEKLKAFPYGLSRKSGFMTFAYHPNATPLSTAYPDSSGKERDMFKNAILSNLKNAPPEIRRLVWLPPFLRSLILDYELNKASQVEQVSCELKTISEVVCEQGIERIDLLKIDVEKSELDVLLGIEAQHWSIIKQIVIEVHDIQNRVKNITALLKENGFSKIAIEQEPILKGSNIFSIYALRSGI